MESQDYVAIFLLSISENDGMKSWNQWRRDNRAIRPNLTSISLATACLDHADLSNATLSEAFMSQCSIVGGNLVGADLSGADLGRATLADADLTGAILKGAYLSKADLSGANLSGANLSGATLANAELSGATVIGADLSGAMLARSVFRGADLNGAICKGAILTEADFSQTNLRGTNLNGANLRHTKMNNETNLAEIALTSSTQLGDIRWNGCDLTVVPWGLLRHLGDDSSKELNKEDKARANRQIAAQLREQGIYYHANRFAYQANVFERRAALRANPATWLPWFGSLLIDTLAGYGYRPSRTFIIYLLIILSYAILYAHLSVGLNFEESFVISMTAFHGRGFFANTFKPGDPQALVAATEAFVGLIVEVSFIATFTQRFFGK